MDHEDVVGELVAVKGTHPVGFVVRICWALALPLFLLGCAASVQESERTGDCARLERLALDRSEDYDVRLRAVEALGRVGTDSGAHCLRRIASGGIWPVAVLAARNMARKSDLMDLAVSTDDVEVLKAAISKIGDPKDIHDVFRRKSSASGRRSILRSLSDQDLVYRIFKEDESLRSDAFDKLQDQGILRDLVQGASAWNYRYRAFQKLDKASLAILGENASDTALVVAARILLGQVGWDSAFSRYETGDVLGAAALVERSKPRSEMVVAACHQFIRQGDASRIPELVKLIQEYGDVSLAEDYMNCGQSDLESAGQTWGRAHGYDVRSGPGSHRVRWGSGR